jgi:hypothetical protein
VDSYGANRITAVPMVPSASYIPIMVVEHNNIHRGQVDTKNSSMSLPEQENELLAARFVVLVDRSAAIIVCTIISIHITTVL